MKLFQIKHKKTWVNLCGTSRSIINLENGKISSTTGVLSLKRESWNTIRSFSPIFSSYFSHPFYAAPMNTIIMIVIMMMKQLYKQYGNTKYCIKIFNDLIWSLHRLSAHWNKTMQMIAVSLNKYYVLCSTILYLQRTS